MRNEIEDGSGHTGLVGTREEIAADREAFHKAYPLVWRSNNQHKEYKGMRCKTVVRIRNQSRFEFKTGVQVVANSGAAIRQS